MSRTRPVLGRSSQLLMGKRNKARNSVVLRTSVAVGSALGCSVAPEQHPTPAVGDPERIARSIGGITAIPAHALLSMTS